MAQKSYRESSQADILSADTAIPCPKSYHPSRASRTLTPPARQIPAPRQRPAINTHSQATPDDLVQPIFSPPSRRPPSESWQSVSRRAADLKMLCVMYNKNREASQEYCHFANYVA